MGRLDELGAWIEAAELSSAQDGTTSLEAAAAMLRCVHRYMNGDVGEAISAAREALELEHEETPPWRSVGCPVLGISLFWRGQPERAAETLGHAIERAQPAGNHLAVIHATAGLSAIRAEEGDLDEAERLARRVTELSTEHGLEEHWATAMAHVVRGKALLRQGHAEPACVAIARAVELSRRGIARVETAYGLLALAQATRTLGDSAEAGALLGQARRVIEECPDPGLVAHMLRELETRLNGAGSLEGRGANGACELTERELVVLRLLPTALSQREIGDELFVSLNTVKTHVRGIYRKLDAATRPQAIERARELHLL
jgi:LuxR family maltose regulon positive regulatory protein